MDIKFWKRSKIKENSIVIKVVLLSVIFGFSAGVVGQIVSHVYLDPYLTSNNYLTNSNQSNDVPELLKVKKFLGTQQDFIVDEISNKVQLSTAGLYLKKAKTSDIAKQIYTSDDLLANAYVLTADGWLISKTDIFSKYNKSQIIVNLLGNIYTIENQIFDPLTGISFIKINAENLPVIVFGDWQESTLGQTVLALNSVDETVLTYVESLDYQPDSTTIVKSTEEFYNYILIKDELDENYNGGILLNLGGEMIGLINGDLITATPVNYFSTIINNVLRFEQVGRPSLGVEFIDLSQSAGLGINRGALIYNNPSRVSPAYQSGLTEGDIILKVDDVIIDKKITLTQLIQEYRIGDEIELLIMRDGKERTVEVFLGEL